ncbi:HAD hydrolase-like protein [Paucibacter sp. O1-1]|nr:HAD hydrolase-like protein [Paucibacter sp. O1-1]MDA3830782.1 HAD hydrolase-like protein [Paucibacter sp. O1-1]
MSQWANIKAIAFDLDGTLIDSVPDLTAATNATLAECHLPEVSDALVRSWVGNGAQVLMQRALSYASSMAEDSTELQVQLSKLCRVLCIIMVNIYNSTACCIHMFERRCSS